MFLAINIVLVIIPVVKDFAITSLGIGICFVGFGFYFVFVYPKNTPSFLSSLNGKFLNSKFLRVFRFDNVDCGNNFWCIAQPKIKKDSVAKKQYRVGLGLPTTIAFKSAFNRIGYGSAFRRKKHFNTEQFK